MSNNGTMTAICTLTEHELLDDTFTRKLYLGLTPFIICIGLLGNILTVCVFILTDLKKQSVSIITIALSIADSFVLLIPVSILWLEKILRRELTDLSPFWCRTHGLFLILIKI
jgi:growth hormone secretagogue receptor